jgi:hypothetical protein
MIGRRYLSLLLVLHATIAIGADTPEIVRVKVPAAKVSSWFSKGTELVSISLNEFDALLKKVEQVSRPTDQRLPLLLKATHRARWVDQRLEGETTLVVRRGQSPGRIPLAPWNLRLEASEGKDFQIRANADGKVSLWLLPEGSSEITYRWSVPARAASRGRTFPLELPATALSSLELDLPLDIVPEGFSFVVPKDSSAVTGRALWRISSETGFVNVRLKSSSDSDNQATIPWIHGPTTVNVGPVLADWHCDWSVDPNGANRPIEVEFSEGLEPIEATGQEVESFQIEVASQRSRMSIRLKTDGTGSRLIKLRGVVAVPADRPWLVPAAKPLNCAWLGGTTTIVLDKSRTLGSCRVLQGERVSPNFSATQTNHTVVLDPSRPEPAAELTFVRSRPLFNAEVRGYLFERLEQTRLVSLIRWNLPKGEAPTYAFDLPHDWVVEQLMQEDEPIEWHKEEIAGKKTRIHFVASPLSDIDSHVSIVVTATRKATAPTDGFELPRIVPTDVTIADELWAASLKNGRLLVPRVAEGLAWIDPSLVKSENFHPDFGTNVNPEHLLSWRWTAKEGRLVASIVPAPIESHSIVEGRSLIAENRVHHEWQLAVQQGSRKSSILPVFWTTSKKLDVDWDFVVDPQQSYPLDTRPLTANERVEAGFPADSGTALAILLPDNVPASISIRGRSDTTWTGSESIPLLCLPEAYHSRSHYSIDIATNLLLKEKSVGLEQMDFDPVDKVSPTLQQSVGIRRAHQFVYRTSTPSLHLTTSAPSSRSANLLISAARLDSTIEPDGRRFERLQLNVRFAKPDELSLEIPDDHRVVRVLRDGLVIPINRADRLMKIPLGSSSADGRCIVTIEYESQNKSFAYTPVKIVPALPVINAPCLTFTWYPSFPSGWTTSGTGRQFPFAEQDSQSSLLKLLTWGSAFTNLPGAHRTFFKERDFGVLVDRINRELQANGSQTLGEMLSKIDGEYPVVIDLNAIDAIGLSPETRLNTRSAEKWKLLKNPTRYELGNLTIVPVGSNVVLTTGNRWIKNTSTLWARDSRLEMLASALQNGMDPSARYQSFDEWSLGEHRTTSQRVGDSAISWPRASESLSLQCSGWPGAEAWLRIEPTYRSLWIYLFGAVVLVLIAGLIRYWNAGWFKIYCGTLIFLAFGLIGFWSLLPSWISASVIIAAIGCLLLRPKLSESQTSGQTTITQLSPRQGSSIRSNVSGVVTRSLICLIMSASLATGQAKTRDIILVLLPYDGVPVADAMPDRVILRLADLERLRKLASTPAANLESKAEAIEVVHSLVMETRKTALLTSDFTLMSEGQAADWQIPLEDAWDIRASLDGKSVAVRISEDGRSGKIALPESGRHSLIVGRRIKVQDDGRASQFSVAVNPVPMSRLIITPSADRRVISLRDGQVELVPETRTWSSSTGFQGKIQGELAPSNAAKPRIAAISNLDSQLLWDTKSAGELLRVRLRSTANTPVGQLRLAIETASNLRFLDSKRVTELRWEKSKDKQVLVAAFDPPYARNEEISVEIWRQARDPETEMGLKTRIAPSLAIEGEAALQGMIAFRRPTRWSGRLERGQTVDPLDDEEFVKAWGTLPDDLQTLAGAIRFKTFASAQVLTGPIKPQLAVSPLVRLELNEGRADLQIETELRNEVGRPIQFDLSIPDGLIVDRFRLEGLASLSRPLPGVLHVEMLPIERETRKLELRGHLFVTSPNLLMGQRLQKLNVPWPVWQDAKVSPGVLTLVAAGKLQFDPGAGVNSISAVDQIAAAGLPSFRKVFKVTRPEDLREVTWQASALNVGVKLLSRIVVGDHATQLHTTIRYNVVGGPVQDLFLKVPTLWAKDAKIEIVGDELQQTKEIRGEWTFWTIRPRNPVWGAVTLVLHAARPTAAQERLAYPDIIPLGHGSVEKILAVEPQTLSHVDIEGSTGLQAVDLSRLSDVNKLESPTSRAEAYRVLGGAWELNLRLRADRRDPNQLTAVPVVSADHSATLTPLGDVHGHTRFQIDARVGGILRFHLDPNTHVVWTAVNGQGTVANEESRGDWLVAMNSVGGAIVDVFWQTSRQASTTPTNLEYPKIDDADKVTLLRVFANDWETKITSLVGWEEVLSSAWLLERAELVAKRAIAFCGNFDRSSASSEEQLRGLLYEFERVSKLTQRSAAVSLVANGAAQESIGDLILSRLERTRKAVLDALVSYSLEELSPKDDTSWDERQSRISLGNIQGTDIREHTDGTSRYFRAMESQGSERLLMYQSVGHSFWTTFVRCFWIITGLFMAIVTMKLGRQIEELFDGKWKRRSLAMLLLAMMLIVPGPGLILLVTQRLMK